MFNRFTTYVRLQRFIDLNYMGLNTLRLLVLNLSSKIRTPGDYFLLFYLKASNSEIKGKNPKYYL